MESTLCSGEGTIPSLWGVLTSRTVRPWDQQSSHPGPGAGAYWNEGTFVPAHPQPQTEVRRQVHFEETPNQAVGRPSSQTQTHNPNQRTNWNGNSAPNVDNRRGTTLPRNAGNRSGGGSGRPGGWNQPNPNLPRLPDRKTSANGYVNGSIPMQTGVSVCFKCGTPGHYSSNCRTPPDKHLQSWESAYLKSMVFQPQDRQGDAPPGGTVDMKSAQLYYQQFMHEEEETRMQGNQKPSIGENSSTSSSSPGLETPVSDVGARLVTLQSAETVRELEESSLPFSELEDDDGEWDRYVSAKLSTAKSGGGRASGKGRASRKLLKKVERLLGEGEKWRGATEQMVDVMILAAGLEPSAKKRKATGGIPVRVEAVEEEGESSRAAEGGETADRNPFEAVNPFGTSQTPPAQKVRKVRKRAGGLVEINAREGLGQVDWLDMARKVMVPLSLVDFWQISPEGAKQFRQLSSRRSASRKSKGKQPAVVSVRAATMGRDSHNTSLIGNRKFNPKSFRLPVVMTVKDTAAKTQQSFVIPRDLVQADQGSESSFISQQFVQERAIPVRDLGLVGFKGLIMTNADGHRTPVTHFVVMRITCMDITREV